MALEKSGGADRLPKQERIWDKHWEACVREATEHICVNDGCTLARTHTPALAAGTLNW